MKGPVAWFAGHRVAANMLMWLLLTGGFVTALVIQQEVFPEVSADLITVSIDHLGASPDEVEEGVCIKVEEAVSGLDGIDRVTSRAVQGRGTVQIEVEESADIRDVLDDVKTAVDAIDTFPDEAESPVITDFEISRQVLSVAISGEAEETTLRRLGEQVRDELLTLPDITRVKLKNVRPYEISIEVPEATLRRYGFTLDEITAAVRASSLDLSGGAVKTEAGEILLRTKAQAYRGPDFENIVLRTEADGSRLLLGDVARVVDGFEDTGQAARFDGRPAVLVNVYRVGDQRALALADRVHEYVDEAQARMPHGITLTTWQDESRLLRSRLDLLLDNGRVGLILVFLTLALFLRLQLAFWVTLGIPISFFGALWLMPALGVSINMISLFGFLVALGIVVDDAIVVGENVYRHAEQGKRGLDAVLAGVGQVRTPVIFAVLTTIAAFSPLLDIPGTIGKFMEQLPLVVVPTLVFSLVESLLILPAHLSHLGLGRNAAADDGRRPAPGPLRRLGRSALDRWIGVQDRVSAGLRFVIERLYVPSLDLGLRFRYVTLAGGLVICMLTFSLVGAGHIRFVFFPEVEADNVVSWLTMPQGTPDEVTQRAVEQIERSALALRDEYEQDGQAVFRHVLSSVGDQPFRNDQAQGFGNYSDFSGGHLGEVNIELVPSEGRELSAIELQQRWRESVGPIAGSVELIFSSNLVSTGEKLNIELKGPDPAALRTIATTLKRRLTSYPGVFDVADSFREGKQEVRLDVTPEAESIGIDRAALARQVRQGFYGDEAQRIQRGRDEVKVMVRYPLAERRSLGDLEHMRVRMPGGVEVPFGQVARARQGRGDAVIQRSERLRSINVTGDVDLAVNEPNTILGDVEANVLPGLLADHPGVTYSLEGEQREQSDTISGLLGGFVLALFLIYALLAIPFRSYAQPGIVMLAIPFGIVGALWGHMLTGLALTVMSVFGIVALTGVIVNDSLVMVDFINVERARSHDVLGAVRAAGPARFRAILLTSLTTFAGLLPLLLERSIQAQFLIPMAVSLGFGVLFATFITLIIVPVSYMTMVDVQLAIARMLGARVPDLAHDVEGHAST